MSNDSNRDLIEVCNGWLEWSQESSNNERMVLESLLKILESHEANLQGVEIDRGTIYIPHRHPICISGVTELELATVLSRLSSFKIIDITSNEFFLTITVNEWENISCKR